MGRFAQQAASFAFSIAAASSQAQDAPHYAVRFDAEAQRAAVRLCLAQAHSVVRFAADSGWAMRFIDDLHRDSGDVTPTAGGWRAPSWRAGECLSYRADLHAIAAERKPDIGWQIGSDFVVAPQLWLLRPDVQGDAAATAHVELPPDWSLSAPWRARRSAPLPGAAGKSIDFQIPNTPGEWSSAVAFGHFDEEPIALAGGVLRLAILGDVGARDRAKLHAWLARISKAALSAYGRLPLPDVQVLMIPVAAHRAAVTFGQSVRGQGNTLELLVNPAAPEAEFDEDWMAVHELSHLMHPYLGDRGAWLAEGLATYYQNVLRARSGLLTAAQAWDRLAEGFRRGAKISSDDTLEALASDMHHSHAFQRVYWAGAAYWLTVDRDLRRDSRGALSLDSVLARFRDCCLPAYREWTPEDFVARLDALGATSLFSTRQRQFARMRQFPEWEKVYADLGIGEGGEHLTFEAASGAAIRDAIMAPRAGAAAAGATAHRALP